MRRSQAEVFSILESINDAFFALDHEWRFAYVNRRAEALFSRRGVDLIGEKIPEDSTFYPQYRSALAEGKTAKFEGYYPPLEKWFSVRAYPSESGISVYLQDITERKKAEERLRFQAQLLNAVGDAVIALDVEGRVLYWNRAAEEMYGWSEEEAMGRRLREMVIPESFRGRAEDIAAHLREGRNWRGEFVARHRDGTTFTVEATDTPVFDEEGDLVGVIGVLKDITERKRAEEALKESEERYRTLVERVPPIVYIQRPKEGKPGAYDTTYISPRIEDILGYPPSRFVEEPGFWDSLIYPDDRERVLAEDERTDRTGEPFAMEYRLIAKDGSVVWLRDEATLVRDEAGEPLYWLGVQMDITDRKYSEEALRDAEERYRTLVEQIPAVTYIDPVDNPEVSIYTSPQIEEMLGYTSSEWQANKLWPERLHPDDRKRVLAADERFEAGAEERFSEEYRLIAKDGSVVWVREEAVTIEDEAGEPSYWQGVIFDITKRKEAEEALRKSEERLRGLADSAFEGIVIADKGEILEANRAITGMLGYELREVVGRSVLEFVAPEHRDLVRHKIASGAEDPYEVVGVRKDGSFLELEVRGRAFSYRGRDVRVTAVRDVTERKAFERRLQQQALHDSLTGLPNRKLFVDRLGHALERTRRTRGRKVAILFMDLDGFKVVNDSLGHEVGDLLLVLVTERLRGCLRAEDTLARFGGDEFVVLVEDAANPGGAISLARRITQELSRPIVAEGRNLFVSTSIGIALGDAQTKTPEELLRDADTAMYRAKEEHADHRVFVSSMYERMVGRLELESDLRHGIEAEEFVVHYQPIVYPNTAEVWGIEALMRWEHPERGLLKPSEFMPVLEDSGLIVSMGEKVLEEACHQARRWQEERPRTPPLVLSVNLSAVQLKHSNLARSIARTLRRTGLDPSCLTLDVTETAYIEVLEKKTSALDRLKELGVGVSIDDFGVGYSSLSYLKRLPADVLKIDSSFVKGIGENVEDTAIVRMVIELAHTLGMKVIAEGVEDTMEATLLAEMGCDLCQGYHFSEPLLPEEVAAFLAQ